VTVRSCRSIRESNSGSAGRGSLGHRPLPAPATITWDYLCSESATSKNVYDKSRCREVWGVGDSSFGAENGAIEVKGASSLAMPTPGRQSKYDALVRFARGSVGGDAAAIPDICPMKLLTFPRPLSQRANSPPMCSGGSTPQAVADHDPQLRESSLGRPKRH